eukprot:TRINITY_DN42_c0_g1_i1.p1 TRINITY_DN42_c0_g1~~TRINITY_DN42_c0_g1_i1.p1  ORF type:complete len:715 (-),score=353.88 TRINITY_DN42_c0_g1_i1:1413-3515(-)
MSNFNEDLFVSEILEGIPNELPPFQKRRENVNHAPKRKDILSETEKKLALKNALRYFEIKDHEFLAKEFIDELEQYGRIYMYRLKPKHIIKAQSIDKYPCRSRQAAAIMLMLQNNLDDAIAQHPDELITYGGNGSIFQNWAQYRLTMKYLATMTNEQTLVLYSGHPLGLFPSHTNAPRVVITNGMMIPNYSSKDDWERFNALGVTQYGQMTAGSFMYIGPQGIVHGTTITVLNAARILQASQSNHSESQFDEQSQLNPCRGLVFVTSGLGGMSGAQAKAAVIAGCIGVIAEVNPDVVKKRHDQRWVDEVFTDTSALINRIQIARQNKEAVSLAYQGNIVDLWEKFVTENISIDLGSDQTSLHNPFSGGYYPVGYTFEEAKKMIAENPEKLKIAVQETLIRHVNAINKLSERGMYFWDYGNAFLLEAKRAGANILVNNDNNNNNNIGDCEKFRYPSYVEDIMGPMCFDYGFGPFRWICTSGDNNDLIISDGIALQVLEQMAINSPIEIKRQLNDNICWIRDAMKNNLVVGSKARILYADCLGRINIARAFNNAIKERLISAPIVLGRDHHDVSGTDSPYRETANIRDGSRFTADMAVQNFVGDAFRGATWVSLHNGGGVGWGEVINGGFGLVLDGSQECEIKLESMLHWDVNNGIARRAWARNPAALFSIQKAMEINPLLQVTIPNIASDDIITKAINKSN